MAQCSVPAKSCSKSAKHVNKRVSPRTLEKKPKQLIANEASELPQFFTGAVLECTKLADSKV